jgi:CRISPR/Cas system-associated exonuclease Cas4 (RecB family)
MEAQVIQLIEAIKDSKAKEMALNRSHNFSSRCLHCGYQDICDQKLM